MSIMVMLLAIPELSSVQMDATSPVLCAMNVSYTVELVTHWWYYYIGVFLYVIRNLDNFILSHPESFLLAFNECFNVWNESFYFSI